MGAAAARKPAASEGPCPFAIAPWGGPAGHGEGVESAEARGQRAAIARAAVGSQYFGVRSEGHRRALDGLPLE